MQLDTVNQFSRITLVLHWVIGLSMIALLAVGLYMTKTESYGFYPWHKSIGTLIFFIVLLRVVWRIKNGWPTSAGQYSKVEHILAKLVHWVLILGTVLMPISGFLMSSLGGHGVDVFGLEVVAKNVDPNMAGNVLAHNESMASFSHTVHHWLGNILILAVVLHVFGALKHHIIDKDGTLKRMLGAKV